MKVFFGDTIVGVGKTGFSIETGLLMWIHLNSFSIFDLKFVLDFNWYVEESNKTLFWQEI